MPFDFDAIVDRSGTNSEKWNTRPGELPMWVADMDFPCAPAIADAIRERLDRGVFGYSRIPEEWAQSYVAWWSDRHGYQMAPESLIFCTGVIPALSSTVRRLTAPDENVVVQTPVYNHFFTSIENNGRTVLASPLHYEDGSYTMDLDGLERAFADPRTTLMFLCNPQNPGGMVWNADDLAAVGELAQAYGVVVVSDEIHCDVTDPGVAYTPFASVSQACANASVTCIAPTKAFNIAGLQTAAVHVPNPALRGRIERALNTDEVAEPNVFAVQAAIAAFTHGAQWLDELRAYLHGNILEARRILALDLPQVRLVHGGATYLLWLDCGSVTRDTRDLAAFLRAQTGLWVTPGEVYGDEGAGFLRVNVACPRQRVLDGMERLVRGVRAYGQAGSPVRA